MRFETFPAHGMFLANKQPKRSNLYRYGINTFLKCKGHKQLSPQVPHSQDRYPYGRLHNQATYPGIYLRRLGRRLKFYNFLSLQFYKQNFTSRTFVIQRLLPFLPRALNYHSRTSNTDTDLSNFLNYRKYVDPVVSRSNIVNRTQDIGHVSKTEHRCPRTSNSPAKVNLSTTRRQLSIIIINIFT